MQGILRDQFPITEEKVYLNNCSAGALSLDVKQSLFDFINDWDEFGALSWSLADKWSDKVEQARLNFAKIIGADKDNVAFMFGNSTAISSIMSSIRFENDDNVIFNDIDFPAIPSNVMARSEFDISYRVVRSNDGISVSTDDYIPHIDSKTKLLTACEVVSNTGFRINTNELIEMAHDLDVPVFLDTYQSTGTIPLNVKKNDVDFLASGALKYLIGGVGISFMYVRDDWIDKLSPASIGWMGVDDPFADLFDKLRINLHRPASATKFQLGTPYPSGAYTAKAGMDIIMNIGIDRIYNHNMKLTQYLIDGAIDLGLRISTPVDRNKRGSIVNIQMENSIEKVKQLVDEGFVLDARANGIRIAPHFYNNKEDMEKLLSSISKMK